MSEIIHKKITRKGFHLCMFLCHSTECFSWGILESFGRDLSRSSGFGSKKKPCRSRQLYEIFRRNGSSGNFEYLYFFFFINRFCSSFWKFSSWVWVFHDLGFERNSFSVELCKGKIWYGVHEFDGRYIKDISKQIERK